MIRRIDLLPVAYVQRRRQRRSITLVVLAGVLVVVLLVGWFFLLTSQVSSAQNDLEAVQSQNLLLQNQIAELQNFADLETEVTNKTIALQTVTAGDLDWPAVMTEIAMVIPGDVWLVSMNASAGATEGASPSATEANPIRISNRPAVGRISFTGSSVCMPGVAKWLIRLATIKEFSAAWLSDATEQDSHAGCEVVDFISSIELSDDAFSHRFEEGLE
jgi:Tfp pilus assembly protein PilN